MSKLKILSFILSLSLSLSSVQVFAEETDTTQQTVTSVVQTTSSAVSVSADSKLHPLGCIPESDEEISSLPRAEEIAKSESLPSSVDLSSNFPEPGKQGMNDCVGWSTTYYYKSYQEKLDHNWDIGNDNHLFSPTYVYNQINDGVDNGSRISDALKLLKNQGACSLEDMQYDVGDYTTQPNEIQSQAAAGHKALSWGYIAAGDITQMKAHLAKEDGLVVSIPVYPDLDYISDSNPVYDNINGTKRGNHAICFVGYDDSKQAFKFINSWGTDWGLNGYGYMSYDLVNSLNVQGFVMTDKDEVRVKDVILNSTSLSIVKGNTSTLQATIMPSNASIKDVKWSSDDKRVAKVDDTGNITGVKVGTATITCTALNDGCKTAKCKVTITDSKNTPDNNVTSNYQKFSNETGTALGETGSNFQFLLAQNNDLYAIKTSQTGSKSTEVHVLSAASNYQNFSNETGTALGETGSNFQFLLAQNNDLYAIKTNQTGSKLTEVHVLSAASNYQNFSNQTGTALGETGSNFKFLLASNNDLYAIKMSQTGSKTTEVHVLSK